jgi:hypothetical protein
LIWPTGYPEGAKEDGAPAKPFILILPVYDYASPEDGEYEEFGLKLSDLYEPLQTGILERVQVAPTSYNGGFWMWLDEEGHVRDRAINLWATELYWHRRGTTHPIAGTIAIEGPYIPKTQATDPYFARRWAEVYFGAPSDCEIRTLGVRHE